MDKQYWADASTKNCVWLFQVKEARHNSEHGCTCAAAYDDRETCRCFVETWRTEHVFLTREEANAHGESKPYEYGTKDEMWRIYGVRCVGLIAELLGRHVDEFKDKVDRLPVRYRTVKMTEKLKQDIERLKEIHVELEEHYSDDEWDLSEFHKNELYRITGMEEHDWDENVLAHYIDGMQRALHLKEVYDE